jgi:hypothetical protein
MRLERPIYFARKETLLATRRAVVAGWRDVSERLRSDGYPDLAWEVNRFVERNAAPPKPRRNLDRPNAQVGASTAEQGALQNTGVNLNVASLGVVTNHRHSHSLLLAGLYRRTPSSQPLTLRVASLVGWAASSKLNPRSWSRENDTYPPLTSQAISEVVIDVEADLAWGVMMTSSQCSGSGSTASRGRRTGATDSGRTRCHGSVHRFEREATPQRSAQHPLRPTRAPDSRIASRCEPIITCHGLGLADGVSCSPRRA